MRCAVKAVNEAGINDAVFFLTDVAVKKRSLSWCIRQAAIAARDALYRFDQFKSD